MNVGGLVWTLCPPRLLCWPPTRVPGRGFLSRGSLGEAEEGGRHPGARPRASGAWGGSGDGPRGRAALQMLTQRLPAFPGRHTAQGDEVPIRGRGSASLSFRPPLTPPRATGTRPAPHAAGDSALVGDGGVAVPREVTPLHGCQDRCWSAHVSLTVSECWATGGAGPHIGSGHRPPRRLSWAAASSSRPVPNLRAQVTTLSPGCPLPLLGQDRDQKSWEGVGSGRTRPGQRSSFRGAATEGGSGRQHEGQGVGRARGGPLGKASGPPAQLTVPAGSTEPWGHRPHPGPTWGDSRAG